MADRLSAADGAARSQAVDEHVEDLVERQIVGVMLVEAPLVETAHVRDGDGIKIPARRSLPSRRSLFRT